MSGVSGYYDVTSVIEEIGVKQGCQIWAQGEQDCSQMGPIRNFFRSDLKFDQKNPGFVPFWANLINFTANKY